MIVDAVLTIHRDELSRLEWKRLLSRLTFFDKEQNEVSVFQYQMTKESTVLPRGAWSLIPDKVYELDDRRSKPKMPEVEFNRELREDQPEAVKAMFNQQQGVVLAPPGFGKSSVALAFVAQCQTTTLVVVHTEDIFNQWVEYSQKLLPTINIGTIRGTTCAPGHLTIATAQTLRRYINAGDKFWRQFGCIIIDECFPAGTLVDGRPIEDYRVGDEITAFDEATGSMVKSRVARLFKRRSSALVQVSLADRKVACTPEHPFWTQRGWVGASHLRCDDMVLCFTHEQRLDSTVPYLSDEDCSDRLQEEISMENSGQNVLLKRMFQQDDVSNTYSARTKEKGSMSLVQSNSGSRFKRGQTKMGSISFSGKSLLFKGVQPSFFSQSQFRDNDSDESSSRLAPQASGVYAREQSNGSSRSSGQGFCFITGSRMETPSSRWEWQAYSTTSTASSLCFGMAGRSSGCNQKEKRVRVSISLQDRHSECGLKGSDRGRWNVPQCLSTQTARCQKGSVSNWQRVESVEVLQPGSDRRFGGLCSDGFVYNLEVEKFHTYTANGIVVHNCHHSAAETWEWILNTCPAYYRFGLTATVSRADGMSPLIQFLLGPIIHEHKFESKVPIFVVPVKSGFKFQYRGPFDWHRLMNALVTDEGRNQKIADLADTEVAKGNSVLVLSRRVEHLVRIQEMMLTGRQKLLIGSHPNDAYSQSKGIRKPLPKERRQIVKDFRRGKIKCLLATQLFDEAMDVPILSRVILTHPGKHDGRIVQQVGRAIRQHPDKKDAVIFDMVDEGITVLEKQFKARKAAYKEMGIPLTKQGGFHAKAEVRRFLDRIFG